MSETKDFLASGEKSFWFSLAKVAGQPIKEVVGSVSYEFGEPVFAIHTIIFEDGTSLFVEGEHDIAYVSDGYGPYEKSTKFVVALSDLRQFED